MVSRGVRLFFPLILLGLVTRAEASEEFIACNRNLYCFVGPCPSYHVIFLPSKAETVFLFPWTEKILPASGRLVRGVAIDKSALSADDHELERTSLGLGTEFVYEGEMTQGERVPVMRARRIVREASMYERVLCPYRD